MTRKGTILSKITIEQEPGLTDTMLTAELDTTHTPPTFAELGVRDEIVRALAEIGIERTFAIQELTLPLALAGEDLIGQARTGMGKTFGFGVPLLHRIATADSGTTPLDGTPRALVIVPTRELCIQVTDDLVRAGKYLRNHKGALKVTAIYGGRPYDSQIAALREGVDVVVGTPGRLLDLAKQNHLILGKIGVLVLDEADEMLDLGFLPDIERILTMVPAKRQTMLFSATMPGPIITLARTFLTRPTHIRAEEPHDSAVHDRTAQFVYRAHALDKAELIARVLQAEGRGATMIFTRTKRTAQKVADDLAERGFAVGAVHGDLGQVQREKALDKFRKGVIDVLVATDVAARGIDIDDVTHVINYQCPEDEKTYVHRIGRTGRAGRTGVAVTLIDWDELNRWAAIDAALGLGIPEPVETYSRSPHLFSDLGIPEGVTGTVRRAAPARTADETVAERPARTPRKRNRRRTLRGKPIDSTQNGGAPDGVSPNGAAENGEPQDETAAVADAAPTPSQSQEHGGGEGGSSSRRKRRRRRRGSSSEANAVVRQGYSTADSAAGDTGRAPTETTPVTAADEAGTTATSAGLDAEPSVAEPTGATERPARRRTRKGTATADDSRPADSAEGAATAPTAAVAAATAEEATGAPAAPRRRTRTRAATAAAGTADATAPEAGTATTVDAGTIAAPADTGSTAAPADSGSGTASADSVPAAGDIGTAPAAGDIGTAPAATEAAPRRRTRKAATAASADAASNDAGTPDAASATGSTGAAATSSEETPAPRRRTRKATSATPAADTTTGDAASASDPVHAGDAAAPSEEAPAPRRRTRKAATEDAVAATATADTGEAATSSEEAPAPRRRARKATTATPAAATATDEVSATAAASTGEAAAPSEEAPAPRRRTRKATTAQADVTAAQAAGTSTADVTAPTASTAADGGAASSAAAAPVDTASADAAPAPRRRATRKSAAATAETGAATVSTADPAAATVDTPASGQVSADDATATTDAEPAPRRRTRKTATTTADTEATATTDADATPRRRTRKATTTTADTEATATTDADATPRRRTRKTADAEATESAEGAAPRRRTRTADDAESGAQPAPKRTRRKAAGEQQVEVTAGSSASA